MEAKSLSDRREQVGRRVDSCFGRARCQCDGAPGQDIARPATQLLLGGPGQRQFVGVTKSSYAMQLFFLVIVIVAVLSWPKGLAAARQL
jgi:hypothetical protein